MKVLIWVHKSEIESGKITNYYNICPQQSMWKDWFQIEVSQDEFARLEDKETGRSTENYTYPDFVNKHYKK
tara:strand:- start:472 stop:684 length:213 start_codon:yes stop_codon:yes gene_type:complete